MKNIMLTLCLILGSTTSFATYKSVSVEQFTCESLETASNGLPVSLHVYKHFTELSHRTIFSAVTANGTAEGLSFLDVQITEQSISAIGNTVLIKGQSPNFSLSIPLSAFSPDAVDTAIVSLNLKKRLSDQTVKFSGLMKCKFPKWIDPNPLMIIAK